MGLAPGVLSAALASIGSSGSGFDVTSTVNAILAAKRAPEVTRQGQETALSNQVTAINQLQTEAASLSDQLFALQDPAGALTYVSATSSDNNVLTATATPGSATGNHTVTVELLAATGSSYSNTVASSSTQLGAGGFTLTANGVSTNFTTGGSINTLDQLAASINSQSLGVNASVITDNSGARLALVASSSGAAADFSTSNETGLSFQHPVPGADARLTVDGVPITSASNTVSGAVPGLTFTLAAPSGKTPVTVGTAPDATYITQAISNFVTAYNTLFNDVASQFKFNTAAGTSGVLASDSAVRSLQEQLLGSTNYSAGTSTVATLASLGISTQNDGSLKVDTVALSKTITSNVSGVISFFQGAGGGGFGGFAGALDNTLNAFTDPTQGAFTVDLKSIGSQSDALKQQDADLERYLAAQQTQLTAQYTKADIALQQLPQTLKQIQTLLGYNTSNGG